MGLLSSKVSITRYRVEGTIESSTLETVRRGLEANVIGDIDEDASEIAMGWTSFESPFRPRFSDASFSIGDYFVFSLRIDKKSVPPKILKKHIERETAKRLGETEREYLTKIEKQELKEAVTQVLLKRIPATPNVYDLIWQYEAGAVWFFSNQKAANEALETLFAQSFRLTLIHLFPYTIADLTAGLKPDQKDILYGLTPTTFTD